MEPHRLVLPGKTWDSISFAARTKVGLIFAGRRASREESLQLAKSINKDWHELSLYSKFYLGNFPDETAKEWLFGRGWQRSVRIAEAFFRYGAFRIVYRPDGVVLLRVEESELKPKLSNDDRTMPAGSILDNSAQ